MQSLATQRTAMAGQAVVAGRPQTARGSRSLVVRAEANDSRRAVLGGLAAGLAGLAVSSAQALTPIDLFDNRAVRDLNEVAYQARDDTLNFSTRDGLDQARADIPGTKKRIKESERRIDTLDGFIKKNYWTQAREELRLQLGTLRFDINTLSASKDKAGKKKALDLKKSFYKSADSLDFALRSKNEAKAASALEATKSGLDQVIAYLL